MKYVAVIDSAVELPEEAIKNLEGRLILCNEYEDIMYILYPTTSIKKAPKEEPVLVPCEYRENDYANGYNQALIDCGVIEE